MSYVQVAFFYFRKWYHIISCVCVSDTKVLLYVNNSEYTSSVHSRHRGGRSNIYGGVNLDNIAIADTIIPVPALSRWRFVSVFERSAVCMYTAVTSLSPPPPLLLVHPPLLLSHLFFIFHLSIHAIHAFFLVSVCLTSARCPQLKPRVSLVCLSACLVCLSVRVLCMHFCRILIIHSSCHIQMGDRWRSNGHGPLCRDDVQGAGGLRGKQPL